MQAHAGTCRLIPSTRPCRKKEGSRGNRYLIRFIDISIPYSIGYRWGSPRFLSEGSWDRRPRAGASTSQERHPNDRRWRVDGEEDAYEDRQRASSVMGKEATEWPGWVGPRVDLERVPPTTPNCLRTGSTTTRTAEAIVEDLTHDPRLPLALRARRTNRGVFIGHDPQRSAVHRTDCPRPSSPAIVPDLRWFRPYLAEDLVTFRLSSSPHVNSAVSWTNLGPRGGDELKDVIWTMDTSAMRANTRAQVALPRGAHQTKRLTARRDGHGVSRTPARRETAREIRGTERSTRPVGLRATTDSNGVSEGSYHTAVDVVRYSDLRKERISIDFGPVPTLRSCGVVGRTIYAFEE